MSLFNWIGRACEESPGVPSSTRLVMVVGSFTVLFTFCGTYIASFILMRPMPDPAISVGTTFLSFLAAMLGAKVIQKNSEVEPTK